MFNLFWNFCFGTFTVLIFTAPRFNVLGTPNEFAVSSSDFTKFRRHLHAAQQKSLLLNDVGTALRSKRPNTAVLQYTKNSSIRYELVYRPSLACIKAETSLTEADWLTALSLLFCRRNATPWCCPKSPTTSARQASTTRPTSPRTCPSPPSPTPPRCSSGPLRPRWWTPRRPTTASARSTRCRG